ncbi:secreted RxLR effector protein 161-like [Hevea brasiliensis]|uniref:secreted RxLR effector protein 161-like n=1 Tax=Hevea brasiliensis TaxID=3981 RepID=UPI0025F38720|nr:secreted RxLR effector protein 161-like [Hevea brasiliensis]
MKDLGEAIYVLGIQIHRNRSRDRLGEKLSKAQCPQDDKERTKTKKIPYSSAVGSLMYAQVCTRPDIAFAISVLGRYLSNPGWGHWKIAKKVMRYLQGTKNYMLTYKRSSNLEVIGYSDSDFAGCVDDRKSTSGYIFMMSGGAVSWKSAKQTLIATSTMEAEYVACYEATCQAVWLKKLISGILVVESISRPLTIYCDNAPTICFSQNYRNFSRTKHFDFKFLFVRENIHESHTRIEHITTDRMITDPLTKALPITIF